MFKKNISINPANPKIKNKKINFEDDNIKPILAYSVFTAKYIIKKKSTILMPIGSFILVLLLSIIPVFLGDVLVHTIFLLVISSITISVTAVFATIKALNLFKDISGEGMEIIIVSKPIRRSQIIFVRFVFFFLLGIIICLLNYFAILIGLLSYYGVSNPSFPIFNYITIFFFSMLVAYIFFGSLSILLSLKFSTKLVSSFSLGFLSMGTVFSQVLPQVIPLMEKSFSQRIREISDYNLDLKYELTTDGKVILYTKDVITPLTPEEVEIINKALETRVDYSWINIVNNFVNPISGFTKISSVQNPFFSGNNYSEYVNFSDYYVSFNQGSVKNNFWENNNYFFVYNNAKIKFNLLAKTDKNPNLHEENFYLNDLYQVEQFFKTYITKSRFETVFNSILDETMVGLGDDEIVQIILDKSKELFAEAFKDSEIKNLVHANNGLKITEIDQKDLEKKISVLFFYLYGIQKLDGHIETFKNRDIFLNSIISNNTQVNRFLNIDFNSVNYDNQNPQALFVKYDVNKENYYTLNNDGQKASSVAVGLSWTAIILIILSSTIAVYYRKDFE